MSSKISKALILAYQNIIKSDFIRRTVPIALTLLGALWKILEGGEYTLKFWWGAIFLAVAILLVFFLEFLKAYNEVSAGGRDERIRQLNLRKEEVRHLADRLNCRRAILLEFEGPYYGHKSVDTYSVTAVGQSGSTISREVVKDMSILNNNQNKNIVTASDFFELFLEENDFGPIGEVRMPNFKGSEIHSLMVEETIHPNVESLYAIQVKKGKIEEYRGVLILHYNEKKTLGEMDWEDLRQTSERIYALI